MRHNQKGLSHIVLLIVLIVGLMIGVNLVQKTAIFQPRAAQVTIYQQGIPVLIVTSEANKFSKYYTEILTAEGLNHFTAANISDITADFLNKFDVVLVGDIDVPQDKVTLFTNWTNSGGNLILMSPDTKLLPLAGLSAQSGTLDNGYILIDTTKKLGHGIVGETIQYHGSADRYTLNGANTLATLYSNATTSTSLPAVTLKNTGSSGGQVAAFSYDLAKSVVLTRQGNPNFLGKKKDPSSFWLPSDLFRAEVNNTTEGDWVNLNKVAIPQADEQQRFLANIITDMNLDKKPLPRFWYLPFDKKAAIVMTGDDHSYPGQARATGDRFDQHLAQSNPGCKVEDWECIRSTSYIYTGIPLTAAEANQYQAQGFEIAVHVSIGCNQFYDLASIDESYREQLTRFNAAENYPNILKPNTNRTHCVAWYDWAGQPKIELKHGIRFDTNYYYYPGSWVQNRPGYFTGSGIPMRFADLDGSLIDVYQATTQLTDEAGLNMNNAVNSMLNDALGAKGYYAIITTNMHTNFAASPDSDTIVAAAKARNVPVVTARQMLTWLDGRNNSKFTNLAWSQNILSFKLEAANGSRGMKAMVPTQSGTNPLSKIYKGCSEVSFTKQTIKGVEYAFFDGTTGDYKAYYNTSAQGPCASPSPTIDPSAPIITMQVNPECMNGRENVFFTGSTHNANNILNWYLVQDGNAIITNPGSNPNFRITLNPGETHLYTMEIRTDKGFFGNSNRVNVTGRNCPAPSPTPATKPNLTVMQTYCVGPTARVHLEWAQIPGATSYNIYRRPLGVGNHTRIGDAGVGTGYNDDTVTVNVSYNYFVQAVNGSNLINGADQDIAVVKSCTPSPTPASTPTPAPGTCASFGGVCVNNIGRTADNKSCSFSGFLDKGITPDCTGAYPYCYAANSCQ